VQDYDETYPMSYDGTNAWPSIVQPYVKSTQVFYCPSSPFADATSPVNGNYGANRAVMPIPDDVPLKMASLQSAASIYMIMDWGTYNAYRGRTVTSSAAWEYLPGMGDVGGTCGATVASRPDNLKDCQSGRHFGGINMAFADGHAKWLASAEVKRQNLSPGYGNWNPAS
jgi:prepilin-type processing-associated H-X9-DG protein